MKFPPNFQYNQGNWQDFTECRRRFYLRAIRRLAWPAIESEPLLENERLGQQGAAFHRLIHQYYLGIPPKVLAVQASDETLRTWLDHFLTWRTKLPGLDTAGARFFPEISLTGTQAGFRLIAKYDLLVILPDGQLIIFDWKTSRNRPRQKWLAERAQTHLYRYLLVNAGQHFTSGPIQPEQVSMVYWFANFPDQTEFFPYSAKQFALDEQTIRQTIESIAALVAQDTPEKPGEGFPLTLDEKRCTFCAYRSLCERGVQAGSLQDGSSAGDTFMEGELSLSEVDFSLEQIAEVEF